GLQLREKQKAKRIYFTQEAQFRNYFEKAARTKGVTGEVLLQQLERRLDSVVLRLGFGISRRQARQLVRHGHVAVNGRKVNIPSYQVSVGEEIAIRENSRKLPILEIAKEFASHQNAPTWLDIDRDNYKGSVLALPKREGFQKPKRLAVDTSTLTDKYGIFWAQPFERGFGTTIGNALRRVLLSSIEGAAVTAVKIEGVLHEFQSIPGVVEDATDIILNLKQIPFKLSGDAPKAIYLRADTPGVVTSGMIEADADVEVLDKDVYVATVSEGGKLDMEMRLKRGRGYVSADKNFDDDLGIGFIPIDSVHSPVRKCNYTVEAARLGQITDYDKLTLEVWTNGSITPADSIGLSAKLLKDHMNIFINFEEDIETATSTEDRKPEIKNENLNRSVEELELSVRSY